MDRHHRLTEGDASALADLVLRPGGVGVDLRVREALLDLAPDAQLRRAGARLHEDAETAATVALLGAKGLGERLVDLSEGALDPILAVETGRALGAVGIVEAPHHLLGADVGRTEARRMRGVALDLGRAADVAGHQQAERVVAALGHGGEVQRDARERVLRPLGVGEDERLGTADAAAQTEHRGAGASGRHEAAATEPTHHRLGVEGVLLGLLLPKQRLTRNHLRLLGEETALGLGDGSGTKGLAAVFLLFQATPDRLGRSGRLIEHVRLALGHR